MKTCPWCQQVVESRMKRFIRFCVSVPVIVAIITLTAMAGLYVVDYAVEKRAEHYRCEK